jgi:hypothetical protein
VALATARTTPARSDDRIGDNAIASDPCLESAHPVDADHCRQQLVPEVFVEIGIGRRSFATVASAPPLRALAIRPPASSEASTYDARVGIDVVHELYVVAEVETIDSPIAPPLQPVLHVAVAAGLHYRVGRVTFGGDLAGGAYVFESTMNASQTTIGTMDARAHAAIWIASWLTLGAFGGRSVVGPVSSSIGIDLGIHAHAFGWH